MNLDGIIQDITEGLEEEVGNNLWQEINEMLRDTLEEVWQGRREVGGIYIYGFDTSLDVDVQDTFLFGSIKPTPTPKVNWKKEGF